MMDITNYEIDHKLKVGKHYPEELHGLKRLFLERETFLPIKIGGPRDRRRINDDIKLIEKTFLDFFLNQANLIKYKITTQGKSHKDFIKSFVKLQKKVAGESGPCDLRVVDECIDRINRRLHNVNPQLYNGPEGYHLDFFPYVTSGNAEEFVRRPSMLTLAGWGWLAKVVDGLDPRLVHQCAYCKKIFFSKQIKKFHPECRSKYFSEKYKADGRNAEKMKRYRQRKKKQAKKR